jgi:hypothetical protein
LQVQAERLGDEDWTIILDARSMVRRAGTAGIAAVIWGPVMVGAPAPPAPPTGTPMERGAAS